MICYKCGSSHIIRNGHSPNGDQKFLCKDCGRSFQIRADRYMGYEEAQSGKTIEELDAEVARLNQKNKELIEGIEADMKNLERLKSAKRASSKNTLVAIVLLLFNAVGIAGLHRFYVGKKTSGILYLFTLGAFGIGSIYDLILLVQGKFRDSDGKLLAPLHIGR